MKSPLIAFAGALLVTGVPATSIAISCAPTGRGASWLAKGLPWYGSSAAPMAARPM